MRLFSSKIFILFELIITFYIQIHINIVLKLTCKAYQKYSSMHKHVLAKRYKMNVNMRINNMNPEVCFPVSINFQKYSYNPSVGTNAGRIQSVDSTSPAEQCHKNENLAF